MSRRNKWNNILEYTCNKLTELNVYLAFSVCLCNWCNLNINEHKCVYRHRRTWESVKTSHPTRGPPAVTNNKGDSAVSSTSQELSFISWLVCFQMSLSISPAGVLSLSQMAHLWPQTLYWQHNSVKKFVLLGTHPEIHVQTKDDQFQLSHSFPEDTQRPSSPSPKRSLNAGAYTCSGSVGNRCFVAGAALPVWYPL